jgi:hypothetical protein
LGRVDESIKALKDNLARHANDPDTLLALVTFNRDAGETGAALDYAERLSRIALSDIARLRDELRARP